MKKAEEFNIENAQAQMKKGILEFSILLVIAGGEAYASDILKKLKQADLIVVEGTLYPILSRLKRLGLAEYTWKESTSGPPRKYYALTQSGRQVIEQLQGSWQSLSKSISSLTKNYEKSN